jgi:hypothetical protein
MIKWEGKIYENDWRTDGYITSVNIEGQFRIRPCSLIKNTFTRRVQKNSNWQRMMK